MIRSENFIYFFTVLGFFISIVFGLAHELGPFEFLLAVVSITSLFYMFIAASSAYFIKYLDIKKFYHLDTQSYEKFIDLQLNEIEQKEEFIKEAHYFIKEIEEEEISYYTNNKGKK